MDETRIAIRSFLGLVETLPPVVATLQEELCGEGFTRRAVRYMSDGNLVEAFLFEPETKVENLAVVALHQHNSQWHLGKSEIAGLAGDPLQAFGPALARAGVTVLAPDAVGFESRRGSVGDNPDRGSTTEDWLQYYNHAMHRLVGGDLLMRTILTDVANAVSVLTTVTGTRNIGVIGHSYGGSIALFSAALDTRIAFAVSSGAACSYRYKLKKGIGLEMALVIPGFAPRFDLEDLIQCVAPRALLIVSSEEDPFSADADDLVTRARPAYARSGASDRLHHLRTTGPHALDEHRFAAIIEWICDRGVSGSRSRTKTKRLAQFFDGPP